MIEHIRRQAVAYLALFVALGGTSYAAVNLPRNSVGKAQLRNNAVTSAKIRNGAVTRRDLARGALPAAGPTGPAGAPGAAGAKGEPGERGETGAQGPAGPTEGASTDFFAEEPTDIGPADFIHDPHTLTTTRPGKLFVSKFVNRVKTTCSEGIFRLFATVDGKRVPGAVTRMAPSGTEHNSVTLTGVTREVVPAGEHVVGTGVDCETGTHTESIGSLGGATVVVLG